MKSKILNEIKSFSSEETKVKKNLTYDEKLALSKAAAKRRQEEKEAAEWAELDKLVRDEIQEQEQENKDDFGKIYLSNDMKASALSKFYRDKKIFDGKTHSRKLTIHGNLRVGNYMTISNQLFDVWMYHCNFTPIELKMVLYLWRQSKGFGYHSAPMKKKKSDEPFFADTVWSLSKKLHIHRDSVYRVLDNLTSKNVLQRYEQNGGGVTYYQVNIFYDTYNKSVFYDDVDVDELVQKEISQIENTLKRQSAGGRK